MYKHLFYNTQEILKIGHLLLFCLPSQTALHLDIQPLTAVKPTTLERV